MNKYVKKGIYAVSTAVIATFITACGADSPDEVAVEFLDALKKGDVATAKEFSKKKEQENIENIVYACSTDDAKKLSDSATDEAVRILDKFLSKSISDKKFDEKMRKKSAKLEKEFTEKAKKLSYKEKVQLKNETIYKIGKMIVDEIGTKKDVNKDALYYAVGYGSMYMEKYSGERLKRKISDPTTKLMLEKLAKEKEKIPKECSQKHTGLEGAKKIVVIDTSNEGKDMANVKVEVFLGEGDSAKYTVGIEKIQGEWKVGSFKPLDKKAEDIKFGRAFINAFSG